ncbi:nonstructural protein 1 [Psittaciform chaphamaparvovirus 3]|nr:nonstructural protein 1 [Psittaciform chaphamaparvovirus 3]
MQRKMEGSGASYGISLWVGSTGTSHDLNREQAEAFLVPKDYVLAPEPIVQRQLALLNMKQHQCCIIQINDAKGEPIASPLIYALFLNNLTNTTRWICTGETNDDGIFHVHAMLQTGQRTDAVRRSMHTCMINLALAAGFREMFGQQVQIECLKLERCHKPESMICYLMKNPTWVTSNDDGMLDLAIQCDLHGHCERFRPKPEQLPAPEMNPMVDEIVNAIISGGCKTFEDLMKSAPGVVCKYLHRPGLAAIVTNCLAYVKATGGSWKLELFAKEDINPEPIHRILLFQGIPPSQFDEIFYKWITKIEPKKNTICLQGPSNTGKSAFISGLKQCVPWGEIINVNTFAFEGITDCVIGVWEEPLCSPELAEKAKQVLEGMQTSIPIKYKKPVMLPRTPIIITTNHDLWRFCSREEEMFRNRMTIFQWMYTMKDQPYIPRTSEYSCQCRYCRASRGGASAHGSASPGGMQEGDQSVPTAEQRSIWPESSSDVRTGSLSGTRESISGSDDRTPSSSSSSANKRSSDSAGSVSSTSAANERYIHRRIGSDRSSSADNREHSSKSNPLEHVESHHSSRGDGRNSRSDGSRRGGKRLAKRRHLGGDGNNLPELPSTSTLASTSSHTSQSSIQVPTKKRQLGGKILTVDDSINVQTLPMYIPLQQDWKEYLCYLYHWYG